MNNSIRKCGPTFFIPWDTVDSMFSLWTKQYFGDQVIRMHLDYDLHDNSYSFCINLVFVKRKCEQKGPKKVSTFSTRFHVVSNVFPKYQMLTF